MHREGVVFDAEEGGRFECRPGVVLDADQGVAINAEGGVTINAGFHQPWSHITAHVRVSSDVVNDGRVYLCLTGERGELRKVEGSV